MIKTHSRRPTNTQQLYQKTTRHPSGMHKLHCTMSITFRLNLIHYP
ncbi:hypothetical protein Patl1_27425 [Pistacia atlantica]|uniref:Uncharacterized protein n=1 Tax=Pistacia atlantica TaxID=434234 RepID=A0ACC1BGH2_9ROSI|nr:hypothetical protein Patl1_27425 [Pistacia atlantica]